MFGGPRALGVVLAGAVYELIRLGATVSIAAIASYSRSARTQGLQPTYRGFAG